MTAALVFDLSLCLLIAAVALAAVLADDLFTAIVLFIVYGLLAAIAWVRLDAIDVALAEAAIGAGLTGLLLVGAAARLGGRGAPPAAGRTPWRLLGKAAPAALCVAAAAALVVLVLALPDDAPGLRPLVAETIAASGVTNPVTAVLLNFRGYDTLLETIVLAVALVGVWSLTPDRDWGSVPGARQHARPDGVLATFGRLLPALGLLVAAHLLWAGADAPGGAFQAGTVLAAVWLVVVMAGVLPAPATADTRVRLLLVAGPAAFLGFGAVGAAGGVFLGHPAGAAKATILAIETALTLSIAATLGLLVLGVPRRPA
ncbi:MAG: DUF4040 domain-containing protein [Xanthobacteraceae bacterium]|nr:DUF4040 domain-containing protein [Xanthobacteraceae bacterium]PWB66037.1 MAG: sodium:proton antiporter [Bradyrhizobiaceae bacterium]